MPRLSKLHEEYNDLRDRFAILAFHDNTVKNLIELDKVLKPVINAEWGGKPLPFPILLDSTGKTVMAYGINSWPTSFLIDPEGKIANGDDSALEAVLKAIRLKQVK